VTLAVEVLNLHLRRGPFRAALFDFDGTLSLIREGWARVMAELGRDLLAGQGLPAGPGLLEYLEDQMLRLSGKPSIYQMRRLAEVIAERGGTPGDPEAYLDEYLHRLLALTDGRRTVLAAGRASPRDWEVPGTTALLESLQRRGVTLYLASGTDLAYVEEEARLLNLTRFFGRHIYAPADNTPNFSKREVIAGLLRENGIAGEWLVGFGAGASETVEVKRAGGVAIGVASREAGAPGVSEMKRELLAELGADAIVADYSQPDELVDWLFGEREI
jgi:phosphoglycolate phosphatase-like HAD superfamily hydrolase